MARETKAKEGLKLPMLVTSPVDVGRLVRELQEIDEAMHQLKLRKDTKSVSLPKTSQLMDQTISLNKLNLLLVGDREKLQSFLETVQAKSPVLHISFSADPPVNFIEKLMTWLRREIHPNVLMTVGLQPTIGAGCMVRSTNKIFDFTLRQKFAANRDLLLQKMSGAEVKK